MRGRRRSDARGRGGELFIDEAVKYVADAAEGFEVGRVGGSEGVAVVGC